MSHSTTPSGAARDLTAGSTSVGVDPGNSAGSDMPRGEGGRGLAQSMGDLAGDSDEGSEVVDGDCSSCLGTTGLLADTGSDLESQSLYVNTPGGRLTVAMPRPREVLGTGEGGVKATCEILPLGMVTDRRKGGLGGDVFT